MCFSWQPGILMLHIVSDALIAIGYFMIAATLGLLCQTWRSAVQWRFWHVRAVPDIVRRYAWFGDWVIWHPDYWIEGSDQSSRGRFLDRDRRSLAAAAPQSAG